MSSVRVILPSGEYISLPAVQEVALMIHEARGSSVAWESLTDAQRLQLIGRVMEVYGAISRCVSGSTAPALSSWWRRVLLKLAGV